jgi:hypothetical protein
MSRENATLRSAKSKTPYFAVYMLVDDARTGIVRGRQPLFAQALTEFCSLACAAEEEPALRDAEVVSTGLRLYSIAYHHGEYNVATLAPTERRDVCLSTCRCGSSLRLGRAGWTAYVCKACGEEVRRAPLRALSSRGGAYQPWHKVAQAQARVHETSDQIVFEALLRIVAEVRRLGLDLPAAAQAEEVLALSHRYDIGRLVRCMPEVL